MPEYRRFMVEGGTYFFTVVTFNRLPILTPEKAREILRIAWKNTQERFPFKTDAICLLPNHLHCIWSLPEGDQNYSVRWKEIKRLFTKGYLTQIGPGETRNESRVKRNEAAIWQRRFWEQTIRDDRDFNQHVDYIHYNPVKHGLVKNAIDWPWSSLHRYLRSGYYSNEWGSQIDDEIKSMGCGE
jgi:putative transposase